MLSATVAQNSGLDTLADKYIDEAHVLQVIVRLLALRRQSYKTCSLAVLRAHKLIDEPSD